MASRFSIACRGVGVHCRGQLVDILKKAYAPTPDVEHVDYVADFKKLVNPTGRDTFAGAPCKRYNGISVPLQFRYRKDKNGVVQCYTKLRHTFKRWSDPWCPWRNSKSSTLSLENMGESLQFPLSAEELGKIRSGLNASLQRLSLPEQEDCEACYEMLANPKSRPFHWEDGGKFLCEQKDGKADVPFVDVDAIDLAGARTMANIFDSVSLFRTQRNRDVMKEITGIIG